MTVSSFGPSSILSLPSFVPFLPSWDLCEWTNNEFDPMRKMWILNKIDKNIFNSSVLDNYHPTSEAPQLRFLFLYIIVILQRVLANYIFDMNSHIQ